MKYSLIAIISLLFLMNSCKNNSVEALSNGTVCDTSAVKYSTTISSLMTNHCTNCHGGSSPSAGISLESHNDLLTYGQASLNAMKNGTMPQGASKLDDCSINKLAAWINQGSLNN